MADVPAIERLIEYDSFDIALTGWYSTTKHHAKEVLNCIGFYVSPVSSFQADSYMMLFRSWTWPKNKIKRNPK